MPGTIVDTLVMRDEVLLSRRADVKKVIDGWFKALEWYKTQPDEGNRIIGAAYKLKPEEVKDIVAGIRFYDLAKNREYMVGSPAGTAPIFKVFDQASSLWKEAGVTSTTVPAQRYIDSSLIVP